MLFRHLTETTISMDFSLLPKYRVLNDAKLQSGLPRTHRLLSERFSTGESDRKSDVKNCTLMVQLISDTRHVHLSTKPKNNELAKAVSVTDSTRQLLKKTKLQLQQLAQADTNRLEEAHDKPEEKVRASVSTSASSDASDADSIVSLHQPVVKVARHGDRRQKAKPTAIEETWKLLDIALIQKTISQPEKCNTDALTKLVHHDKRQRSSVCIPLELMTKDVTDPRLNHRKDTREKFLDLPLPKFNFVTAQVLGAGERQNELAVDTEMSAPQRPIGVIIGAGELAEPTGDREHWMRCRRTKSLLRSISRLEELDDTEFGKFSHELDKFQQKVDAVISQHYSPDCN